MSLNTKGIDFNGKILQIIPPAPSESTRGGVIAEPKGDNDTVEIKVGEDGKLYAPTYPTGTGTANVQIIKWEADD